MKRKHFFFEMEGIHAMQWECKEIMHWARIIIIVNGVMRCRERKWLKVAVLF